MTAHMSFSNNLYGKLCHGNRLEMSTIKCWFEQNFRQLEDNLNDVLLCMIIDCVYQFIEWHRSEKRFVCIDGVNKLLNTLAQRKSPFSSYCNWTIIFRHIFYTNGGFFIWQTKPLEITAIKIYDKVIIVLALSKITIN